MYWCHPTPSIRVTAHTHPPYRKFVCLCVYVSEGSISVTRKVATIIDHGFHLATKIELTSSLKKKKKSSFYYKIIRIIDNLEILEKKRKTLFVVPQFEHLKNFFPFF